MKPLLLTLEKTTGRLLPAGVAPLLPRGGAQPIALRFLQNGVAALFGDGTPIALKLYALGDQGAPIAVLTGWTAVAADLFYAGSLDTLAGALAGIQSATLYARISYGDPNVDGQFFLLRFGGAGAAAADAAAHAVVSKPAGPTKYAQPLGIFSDELLLNQVEGYFKAQAAAKLNGLQLHAQTAPTDADVHADVVINGVAQGKIAILAAGSKSQETIFDAPIVIAAGDVVQFKPTQIGSATPGEDLSVAGILELI